MVKRDGGSPTGGEVICEEQMARGERCCLAVEERLLRLDEADAERAGKGSEVDKGRGSKQQDGRIKQGGQKLDSPQPQMARCNDEREETTLRDGPPARNSPTDDGMEACKGAYFELESTRHTPRTTEASMAQRQQGNATNQGTTQARLQRQREVPIKPAGCQLLWRYLFCSRRQARKRTWEPPQGQKRASGRASGRARRRPIRAAKGLARTTQHAAGAYYTACLAHNGGQKVDGGGGVVDCQLRLGAREVMRLRDPRTARGERGPSAGAKAPWPL